MWSLTTMPRFTVRPALRPSSTFGRMPAATTTRSASTRCRRRTRRPRRARCRGSPSVAAAEQHVDAELLHLARRRYWPPSGSSCRSISVAIRCTTVTSQPCTCRPRAASRPSRPPPITTASVAGPGAPHQRARVVERAEREDAVLVEPVDRRHPRRAAGRQQQRVVRRHAAVVAGHGLRARIDVDDAHADAQVDARCG